MRLGTQATYCGRLYLHRAQFVADFPEHAATARELICLRPDCRSLRFRDAHVSKFAWRDGVASVTVTLESVERKVWILVWETAAGLLAETVLDSERKPWEPVPPDLRRRFRPSDVRG